MDDATEPVDPDMFIAVMATMTGTLSAAVTVTVGDLATMETDLATATMAVARALVLALAAEAGNLRRMKKPLLRAASLL
jgi:hypothetical protein